MSKQWQRFIYNKQFVIEIRKSIDNEDSLKRLIKSNEYSKPSLDREALESVLKKCQNIRRFLCDVTIDSSILSLIGQNCHRIKSLKYYPSIGSDETVLSFYRIYGHKLEELHLYEDNKDIQSYLEFCPNLKNIFALDFSVITSEDKEFLPKLERIESIIRINSTSFR